MENFLLYKVMGYDGKTYKLAGRYYTRQGSSTFCGMTELVYKKDRKEPYWPSSVGSSAISYQQVPMGYTPEQAVENFREGCKSDEIWYGWLSRGMFS